VHFLPPLGIFGVDVAVRANRRTYPCRLRRLSLSYEERVRSEGYRSS
jgi:hypothetical protein